MKVQVTKCYLVQVLDSNGNELSCEYVFGDRGEALKAGAEMKAELERMEDE